MEQQPDGQTSKVPPPSGQRNLLQAQPLSDTSAAPQPARPVPIGSTSAATTAGGLAAPLLLTPEQLAAKQSAAKVQQHGWAPGRKAIGVREEIDERTEEGSFTLLWRDFVQQHQSWGASMLVHVILVLILALLTLSMPESGIALLSSNTPDENIEDLKDMVLEKPQLIDSGGDVVDRPEPEPLQPDIDMRNAAEGINSMSRELIPESDNFAPYNDLINEIGRGTGFLDQRGTGKGNKGTGHGLNGDGGGLGGRGGRRGPGNGATKESELAVDLALKWLAEHQMTDGGWSFHHGMAPNCQGQCPNDGSLVEARIAATAYGLLPFLGAGETNRVGRYKETVARGLQFLIANMKVSPNGGNLTEGGGRMYSQGLATIALCEAYGMQSNAAAIRKQEYQYYERYRNDGLSGYQKEAVLVAKKQKPILIPALGPAAE